MRLAKPGLTVAACGITVALCLLAGQPAGAAMASTTRTSTHAEATRPAKPDSASGVVGGALFGGDMPLNAESGRLGRKLAIVRLYFRIGEPFNPEVYQPLMMNGTTLLVSLDAGHSRGMTYAAIAAGKYDAEIKPFLESVNQAAVTSHLGAIYFCFEHEANLPGHLTRLGSPAGFVKAWDHVHQLAVAAHLNWQQGGRLHWVMILMQEAYVPASRQPRWARAEGQASQYWPGSQEADIVAADGYNSAGCRNVHIPDYAAPGTRVVPPAAMFGPAVSFARAHGDAPVFIAEWGTVPYKVKTVAPAYIHLMQQFITTDREVAGAMYWDTRGSDSCNYSLGHQPASLAALAAMGHSAGLQGHT